MGSLADKAEGLVLTDGHDVLFDELVDIVTLLAGKVAAVGKERVGIKVICTIRNRTFHDDVSFGDTGHHRDQRR